MKSEQFCQLCHVIMPCDRVNYHPLPCDRLNYHPLPCDRLNWHTLLNQWEDRKCTWNIINNNGELYTGVPGTWPCWSYYRHITLCLMYSIISMEYSIINTLIYVDNNPFQIVHIVSGCKRFFRHGSIHVSIVN